MGVHTPGRGGFQVAAAGWKGEFNQPRALTCFLYKF